MAALAVGSLLTPLLVHVVGARGALVGAAVILPFVVVVSFRRLHAVDAQATVPVVEIALLRSLPMFAPLGAPALESLARSLRPTVVRAGTDVVVAGDRGDIYYAVADGELAVSVGGVLRRGDGFGEIALLRDVPRTATVTATRESRLYALGKADFLAAVTGHPDAHAAADALVRQRLRDGAAPGTIGR
jgi:hypothetical protein